MRLGPVIDPAEFSPAELSALRLDGDCFRLGDGLVSVDQPVDATTRGAVLAADARPGLVAEGATAAWVHGATWLLHRPLRFSIDRSHRRRTVPAGSGLREVWFEPQDVQCIGGLPVTTSLRTAFDLARLEPSSSDIDLTITTLLRSGGLDGLAAAALLQDRGTMPYKRRGVDCLARLHC